MTGVSEEMKPVRVLVLEDEPMILMELGFAVEDEGALAITTNTPEKALAAIETERPDSAILDVNLGRGVTCEAVADRLCALDVPFVLHSGDLMRQGELIARIGAEVIAKPAASGVVAQRAVAIARSEEQEG